MNYLMIRFFERYRIGLGIGKWYFSVFCEDERGKLYDITLGELTNNWLWKKINIFTI